MTTLASVDWEAWSPTDRATLLFVVRGGEILLIRKKRGLGAGKINGPGGRIEPGEAALDAAVRECEEEVGIRALDATEIGWLAFQFVDGYSLSVRVFRATRFVGEARETEEAVPLWVPLHGIPFDAMWADDALWMPKLLAGTPFWGRFVLEGDRLLDHEMGSDLDAPHARALFARFSAPVQRDSRSD